MSLSDELANAQQAAFEATATRERLAQHVLAAARVNGRLPGRRFRVEGTDIGNSRLLTLAEACKAAGQYGGRVFECIPARLPASVRRAEKRRR